mmetsp:Transcript_109505/g.244718  ORF Transcript_109505/g.244718 Transcript_109505/m.244718 type:complete len:93 (+) Transcript_109505:185-463(+)
MEPCSAAIEPRCEAGAHGLGAGMGEASELGGGAEARRSRSNKSMGIAFAAAPLGGTAQRIVPAISGLTKGLGTNRTQHHRHDGSLGDLSRAT